MTVSPTARLDGLVKVFRGDGGSYEGHVNKYLYNESGRECWWQVDDRDGMEFSISGNGCRPTINGVLFGEAQAIATTPFHFSMCFNRDEERVSAK